MEIAVESPERFPTGKEEISRPIEAAVKKHREFDYDGLVRPMESRMMRSIWRIVRHRETAEDALQDALAVIWMAIFVYRRVGVILAAGGAQGP